MKAYWKPVLLILLIIAGLLPIIRLFDQGFSSILIFSVFVVVFLWKGLQHASAKLPGPLSLHYIVLGTLVGGLTQLFVQLEGLEKTFSAVPIVHFVQALTLYFWVVVAWYFILRKYDFSIWGVFWVTGVWGVVVEAILLNGSFNPLIWLFIFIVYGSFAAIPYLLTREKFSANRKRPTLKIYLLILGLLALVQVMANALIYIMALMGIK